MKEWMRTPQVLLQEFTQAEKRPKPRYDKLERADDRGVRFRVVLQDAKRPGTDKDLLFTMGRAHGCASDDEARHTVALLALHALGLGFAHPETCVAVDVTCPVPAQFAQIAADSGVTLPRAVR